MPTVPRRCNRRAMKDPDGCPGQPSTAMAIQPQAGLLRHITRMLRLTCVARSQVALLSSLAGCTSLGKHPNTARERATLGTRGAWPRARGTSTRAPGQRVVRSQPSGSRRGQAGGSFNAYASISMRLSERLLDEATRLSGAGKGPRSRLSSIECCESYRAPSVPMPRSQGLQWRVIIQGDSRPQRHAHRLSAADEAPCVRDREPRRGEPRPSAPTPTRPHTPARTA